MLDTTVGQELALPLILSAFYISPILHIFEKRLKSLKIPISFLSFIDKGLLITQSKSLSTSSSFLFSSYHIIFFLIERFGLILEYSKTKVFHFSRTNDLFNSLSLNLSPLGGPVLQWKNLWRYLSFIFDRKLIFWAYVDFYTNKVISIVKSMILLGKSFHSLVLKQKHLIYRSYVLPITLYDHQL